MDLKSIIISLLSITVVVLSVLLFNSRGHFGYDQIDNPEGAQKGENEFCVNTIGSNDGAEIDVDGAKACIKAYDECDFDPDIMAYHIGLNTLKKIVNEATTFNQTEGITDSIIGYRFYNAITSRLGIENKKDLITVPSLSNGKDFFDVGYNDILGFDGGNVRMYSKFRPCPRICGSDNLFYSKN